jgi:hypothetical protein
LRKPDNTGDSDETEEKLMGIMDYKRFLIYCTISVPLSLLLSYIRCQWPWPRLLSFGAAIDIFWLCIIFYFMLLEKNVRRKWDQNVKSIIHLDLRVVLIVFVVFDLLFIFPEYVIEPMSTYSPLMYLRTLMIVSLFIGSASAISFSLGWSIPIKIADRSKGDIVRVLSNLITAISFFGIILTIFSHVTPSQPWIDRLPQSFPRENITGLFGQFSSTLLYFTSLCIGIGSVVTGMLMSSVSHSNEDLFYFLGALFCLTIGLVVGYAIGPLVFFAVTEVAFASEAMISIGLIACMLSKEPTQRRRRSNRI